MNRIPSTMEPTRTYDSTHFMLQMSDHNSPLGMTRILFILCILCTPNSYLFMGSRPSLGCKHKEKHHDHIQAI